MRIVTLNALSPRPGPVNSPLWAASMAHPMPGGNTRGLVGGPLGHERSAAENLSPWEREY